MRKKHGLCISSIFYFSMLAVYIIHINKHITELESVQRHDARFTIENYHSKKHWCFTNMVTQFGWDLLEHRIAEQRIIMLHKIVYNLVNIPVHHRLKVYDSSTRGSVTHKFRQLSTKLNCYKYSLLPGTIISWNTLPLEVRHIPCLEQFQHVSQILLPLLNRPAHSKATLGDRSFSFASSSVWNSIPNDVRCAPSLSSFKSRLKTYLLRSVYKD